MIKEAIGTGRTVNEAIEAARAALGPQEADIELEVLELPKKTFFGLKQNAAKVRAYVILPDPVPEKQATPAQPQRPAQQPQRPAQPPQQAKQPPVSPKPEKPRQPQPSQPERPKQAPAQKQTQPKQDPFTKSAAPSEKKDSSAGTVEPAKIEKAHKYISEIFGAMGLKALNVTPGENEGAIVLRVEGEDSAAVIGRRGETLDALQYLTSLAANRGDGNYARVIIDTGNYRERRQETLESLAKRIADRVIRTGRSHTLEPMNAYERRIIHSAVSEIRGATSSSIGDEPNRRVIISSKRHGGYQSDSSSERQNSGGYSRGRGGSKDSGDRNNGERRSGGRGDRNSRPRREKPEPYKESSTREVAPKEAANKPLYGKVEI